MFTVAGLPPLPPFIQPILLKALDILGRTSLYDSAMPGSLVCSSTRARGKGKVCPWAKRLSWGPQSGDEKEDFSVSFQAGLGYRSIGR